MRHVRLSVVSLFAALCLGLAAEPAEGGIILRGVTAREVLDPVGVYEADFFLEDLNPGVAGQVFFQGSSLSPADPMFGGDLITALDIPDLISDVAKPPVWLDSVQDKGFPINLSDAVDSPSIPNITFRLNGNNNRLFLPNGQTSRFLGRFSWQTADVPVVNFVNPVRFYWQTSKLLANGDVIKESGLGSAPVTFLGVIPEPTSLAMTAVGLALASLVASRRRFRLRRS